MRPTPGTGGPLDSTLEVLPAKAPESPEYEREYGHHSKGCRLACPDGYGSSNRKHEADQKF
jgi:hypothetical protein